jgi:hypothetical protein
MPTRIIACSFSLIAFALALVIGLIVDNPTLTILRGALVAGFVCLLLGAMVGHFAHRVIEDDIERYRQEHPIPDEDEALAAAESQFEDSQDAEATEAEPVPEEAGAVGSVA